MLSHNLQSVFLVLQIEHLAQLVDLVVGNHLHTHQLLHILEIGLRCSHHRHAGPRQGNLGGGGKFKHHIRISCFPAQAQNVREGHIGAVKFMYTISIVPHQNKIRCCRPQTGQAADGIRGIDDSIGIGVFRHTPDALHRRILHQLLHLVHVRSRYGHGDGDELCAEGLRNPKMPVIARGRAQKFHLLQAAPGCFAVQQAMGIGFGNEIIHQGQAGVSAGNGLLHPAAQHPGPIPPGGRQTCQFSIVTGIDAVGEALLRAGQDGENVADHVQLGAPRLPPGHV